MLSNVVSVKVESDSESDAFYRHVLLTKFTATWCGPCAQAQRYFEQLKPEESERFLVVAAHQGDRLTVPVGSALGAKLGYQYVPTWNYDFRTVFESVGTGGITATSIRNQIKSAMEEYPAVCGVKAESELDGQTAKIRATVRFQQAGNYKIACVLTENDIQKTNNETLPVFNHVLRAALTNMEGDPIAPAVAETVSFSAASIAGVAAYPFSPHHNKVTENRTVIRKSRFIRRSIWNYRTTAGS